MIALSFHRTYLCLLLAVLCMNAGEGRAQDPDSHIAASQARIAQDLESIRRAEQEHLADEQRGALWVQLAAEYQHATQFLNAEDAYNRALHFMKPIPSAQAEYASTLDLLATLYLIHGRLGEAESVRKQALTVRQRLGSQPEIGVSHIHLADIALARHQFKKAEQLAQEGMSEIGSSAEPPRGAFLSGLISLTYARCWRGKTTEGVSSAQQAVAFANTHFEPDSPAAGFALQTLGFAEWKSGATEDAGKAMARGIELLKGKLAPADPRLAGAMMQYRAYLLKVNRRAEAQEIEKQVSTMRSESGVFCSGCTVSVYSLSKTLR